MNFVFDFSINDFFYMVKGLGISLTITFWSIIFGTILGVIFGFIISYIVHKLIRKKYDDLDGAL